MRSPPIEKPAASPVRPPVLRGKFDRGLARGSCDEKTPLLQPRLEIGDVDDPLEREADRAADAVLAGGGTDFSPVPVILQRHGIGAGPVAGTAPPSVHRALAEPGRPLDSALRRDLEPRFGRDFSHVRIHSGERAARSAGDVDALAYTVGRDIVFGPGLLASEGGRDVLAHELAHVAQQTGGAGPVLRRQKKDGRKKKKSTTGNAKEKPAAKAASTIGGAVAEGDPLTAAELAAVQTAGEKVEARFRRYVAYKDMIKVGGSLAWRFNNPGNLRSSALQLTRLRGGVGSFAVFADMATGRQAQKSLYLDTYGKMSVRDAIEKLTPRSENDTSGYLKALSKGGVDLDKDVASQIDLLMREVEKNEGLIEGVVLPRAAKAPAAGKGSWRGVPWRIPDTAPTDSGSWLGSPWRLPGDN